MPNPHFSDEPQRPPAREPLWRPGRRWLRRSQALPPLCLCAGMLLAQRTQAQTCTPQHPAQTVAPGVFYYDCGDTDPAVHLVSIDRSLPDVELRLLGDREEGEQLRLTQLDTLVDNAGALLGINGYYWAGGEGIVACLDPVFPVPVGPLSCYGAPETTTYFGGTRHSDLNTTELPSETIIGFASGGPEGLQVNGFAGDQLGAPENAPFLEYAYGASRVMVDGAFAPAADDAASRQSITAYSPSAVILLTSTEDISIAALEATLAEFGVTDAIQNDQGRSARLVVRGSAPADPDAAFFDRAIAYGLGLFRRDPVTVCNTVLDANGAVIGSLCLTPQSTGYDASFTSAIDGTARCGQFSFNLVSRDGVVVPDLGAFPACTSESLAHTYFFETGTLGGCATLRLLQTGGDDFGVSAWVTPACGEAPAPDPDPTDPDPPDPDPTDPDPPDPDPTDPDPSDPDPPNEPPSLSLAGPQPWQLFVAGSSVALDAAIDDTSSGHGCNVDWDDGTTDVSDALAERCTFAHVYDAPGMYSISVSVTDAGGLEAQAEVLVIVHDPHSRAWGSGRIDVAATQAAEERHSGSSGEFELELGYPKSRHDRLTPRGELALELDADRELRASSFEWLIANEDGAFAAKGVGRLRHQPGRYGFLLYGADVDSRGARHTPDDRLRVLIWPEASGSIPTEPFTFDNQPGGALDLDEVTPPLLEAGHVEARRDHAH